MKVACLILLATPTWAAPTEGCPPLPAPPSAATPDVLWAAEAELLEAPPCVERALAPPDVLAPAPVNAPLRLPRPPEGPGAGPWVLLAVAAACAGGVGAIDYLANGARDDFAAARAAGDEDTEDDARLRLEQQRQIAWAVAGVGAGALAGSLVWFAVGGDDAPPQSYPVFSGRGLGWVGRF